MNRKSLVLSVSLITFAILGSGCAVVPDRHGGERLIVSPIAAAAVAVGAVTVAATQPVDQQPVYQQPMPVYIAPPPPVQPVYQVVYPQPQLESLVMAAAIEDIVFVNGSTYVWHIDGRGHREAVLYGQGDRRGELMARREHRDHRGDRQH